MQYSNTHNIHMHIFHTQSTDARHTCITYTNMKMYTERVYRQETARNQLMNQRAASIKNKMKELNEEERKRRNLLSISKLPKDVKITLYKQLEKIVDKDGVNVLEKFPLPAAVTFYRNRLLSDIASGLVGMISRIDELFAEFGPDELSIKPGKHTTDICEHSFGSA